MGALEGLSKNSFYSARFGELAHLWSADPALRSVRLCLNDDELASCVRAYPYAVSAWPVIVSAERIAEFDSLIQRLLPLYRKAMRVLLGHDAGEFASYLEVSPLLQGMLERTEWRPGEQLNRYDAVYSGGQLKVVEVNAGSTIGGWQLSWMETQLRKVLAANETTTRWALNYRNMITNMFSAMFAALERNYHGASGNILLVNEGGSDAELQAFLAPFREVFERARPASLGGARMFACADASRIGFDVDGSVVYEGARIDAVMTLAELARPVMMRLIGAQLAGHILMPDNPVSTLYGNKTLMALLHEPALQPHLDDAERALIARHIPFTARLREQTLAWQGRSWQLRALLLARREDFVIKKAHSMQGRDVYVGKFCDDDAWQEIVARLFGTPDWLAQAYCAPDTVVAPDASGELAEWALVWGIFDTGGHYGGAFVRGMPLAKRAGVINSATGAVEFAVFEEAARRQRVTL